MKVTIIRGPQFEQRQQGAYKLLYKIICKALRDEATKQTVSIDKGGEKDGLCHQD